MSGGELILYTTEDGNAAIRLRAEDGTVWLTQLDMATLFATTKQNVSLHIKNILAEGELTEVATVKESLTVQTEGGRQVRRSVLLYNLDMILAVGYRVKSPRGTQFRQWATAHLREYLVKGFVLDDDGKYAVTIGDKAARDHIKAFLDSDDGKAFKAAPVNGGGGALGGGGGDTGGKTMHRDQFATLQPREQTDFVKGGGKIVDQAA